MKALILNSGMGCRMGVLTSEHPKCMTEISSTETILSRQLKMLADAGITEAVMTTGMFDSVLLNYCQSLELPIHITFVNNALYRETNYIYSIYCAREYLDDDIILMHGDLVFEYSVLGAILSNGTSCMAVSSTLPLPEKDFKAVIREGRIQKVGIEFFNEAMAAQPLYFLKRDDWQVWLERIIDFCEAGNRKCYAENAFNEVSEVCAIVPLDVRNALCSEIDNPEDLAVVSARLREVENRTVYMCFSADVLHSGHIELIKKAKHLGKVIIGVLSDEAVAGYKRLPMVPFSERRVMFENIAGIYRVVEQETLSYRENLQKYRPTYVVHGDDWQTGFQRPVRDEVVSVLASYGGQLVEYPYSRDEKYEELENRVRVELSLPDVRRARLRKILAMKKTVTAMEAHSGISGLLVEKTAVQQNGGVNQFDAIWVSSLCDSAARGKPDIELVDMTSRFHTVDDIMEVTTKPIIFDGNTGGLTEHFAYTVRTLERMGISMVVIGQNKGQAQDSSESLCEKIAAGKKAQKTRDFMICAEVEVLASAKEPEEALSHAFAFVEAGADAVLVQSMEKERTQLFEFVDKFREKDQITPIAVMASCQTVTEEELQAHGVNLIIYGDQLTRAGFSAMQNVAGLILEHHRTKECDDIYMPMDHIVALLPRDN